MLTTDRLTAQVARTGNRVFRPRDLGYKDATLSLRRLVDRGAAIRAAHGYYVIPPDTHRGVRRWTPSIEAISLGIALADYPRDAVALMGISSARAKGYWPRAQAVAVVAIPKSFRPSLSTDFGKIRFVSRDVKSLDVERVDTEVVRGWTTTVEQTLLDLAARPTLGGITVDTASHIITEMARDAEWTIVEGLAARQRLGKALIRASWLAAAIREVPTTKGRRVPSLGLRPVGGVDDSRFGIIK